VAGLLDDRRAGRRVGPASAAGPDRSGLTIVSGVTSVADGRLRYRGIDVADLVGRHGFEEVAELLWTGLLPTAPPRWTPSDSGGPVGVEVAAALPAATLPADRLRVLVAATAAGDELRADLRPEAVLATGRSLLAAAVEAVAPGGAPAGGGEPGGGGGSVAQRLARGWEVRRPVWVEVIDATLVLMADHELATSTMAVRVAASVRADPYHALLAGLCAMAGVLHGSAGAVVYRLLSDAATDGPERAVGDRLRSGGMLAGFGHRLYPDGDPRLTMLLERVRGAATRGDRRLAVVEAVLEVASARVPAAPNVDFALAAFAFVAGWDPSRIEALFSVARMAGWLAHAIEEYEAPPLRYRLNAVPPPS
jgi:citrate synthase